MALLFYFLPTKMLDKSTACGCQGLAAAAFRNTFSMFVYKQQYYLYTFKWQYHYFARVQDDPFRKDDKVIFS